MEPWSVIVLAILILGGSWFLFAGKGLQQGGGAVLSTLISLGPDYRVLNDIILSSADGMIDIDYAVVSPYGVFIIDERLESGTVYVAPGRREWAVSRSEPLHNPLWRTRRVVNHLQTKLGNLQMVSMVVFVNARLKGQRDPSVLRLKELNETIKSYRSAVLSEDQQKTILQALGERNDRQDPGGK